MVDYATTEYLIKQGEEAYYRHDYETAIDFLNKSLDEDPQNLESHYMLGISYSKKEQYNQAIKHFSLIINSDIIFVHTNHVRIMIAYIYILQGKYEQAHSHLKKSIAFDDTNITALSLTAFLYHKTGNIDKAIEYYKNVLEVDEGNINALNCLGFILIDSGIDIDKGLQICKELLEKKPNHPAIMDSIGWGLFKSGDEESAVEYLRKAFELEPDNQEIKTHLREMLDL